MMAEDVVVTNKVSYSNSNDSDEFQWAWNIPGTTMPIKIFFNDYTRQLHVSALTGNRRVFFKRTHGPTIYIYIYVVRTRDGEIVSSLEEKLTMADTCRNT
jgi:ketosteroid isomerase-like protein